METAEAAIVTAVGMMIETDVESADVAVVAVEGEVAVTVANTAESRGVAAGVREVVAGEERLPQGRQPVLMRRPLRQREASGTTPLLLSMLTRKLYPTG